jgi:DNA polymerase zeta
MEPKSNYYEYPVVVLDFQSLYPSIMIAYNYCYSTCLGRFDRETEKLGFFEQFNSFKENVKLDDLIISPNGLVYVNKNVRTSLLSLMLESLLNTRVMVKQAMKEIDSKTLLRILDSRQLGLKLLANVTYGYTAASFSGRMPCSDIADSIVETGRLILEKAIKTINSHPTWNANVVYGDTDSIFIHFPNSSVDRAFKVGKEISEHITSQYPDPIFLKFEKVYRPCFLISKKRYVGMKYESPYEKYPQYEAKGIETVRRDGCPAVAKIMEKSLKIFFAKSDVSELKQYLLKQWTKILENRISVQDFIIAKEVKLGSYSSDGKHLPPGAYLSSNKLNVDQRDLTEYKSRVPYLITSKKDTTLCDAAQSPRYVVEK